MGFKRTTEGRVFFSGASGVSNDETGQQSEAPSMTSPEAKKQASQASQTQMLTLLRSLNDKLQLSQIERKSMRQELESYRALIEKLEAKADRSDEAYKALQNKVATDSDSVRKAEATAAAAMKELEHARELFLKVEGRAERADRFASDLMQQAEQHKKVSLAITKKQSELERKYNEQQSMLAKETISYDDLVERLSKTEQKQLAFEGQFQNALKQQARLVDTLDKEIESRARFMRKIEHIEQTVTLTQDTLANSSQSAIEQGEGRHLPDHLAATPKPAGGFAHYNRMAIPLMVTGAVALLLAGWGISTLQQPDLSAFQERFIVDNATAPIATPETTQSTEAETQPWSTTEDVSIFVPEETEVQIPSVEEQLDMNEMMETDAFDIAAQLNAIEPGQPVAAEEAPTEPEPAIAETPSAPAVAKPEAKPEPKVTARSYSDADPALPKSVKEVETMALQGIPEAQHDLAAIYVTGHAGVEQDYARAAYWFEQAAENGIVNASYNLGVLYHQGLGVTESLTTAMRWYEDAAEQGHPEAQYNLGIAAIEGIGVEYDPTVASLHFEKAAQNGVTEAAYNLGLIYENGLLGTPKPDEALMWYKTAADAGSPEAQSALNQLANSLSISPEQIDQIVQDVRAQKSFDTEPAAQKKTETTAPVQLSPSPVPAPQTPKPEPAAQTTAAVKQPAPILQVQENLMRLGLYPGPADGRTGPLTEDAIRTYQSLHQLNQTGQASAELLMHMQGQI